jgi:hypothetical protein
MSADSERLLAHDLANRQGAGRSGRLAAIVGLAAPGGLSGFGNLVVPFLVPTLVKWAGEENGIAMFAIVHVCSMILGVAALPCIVIALLLAALWWSKLNLPQRAVTVASLLASASGPAFVLYRLTHLLPNRDFA